MRPILSTASAAFARRTLAACAVVVAVVWFAGLGHRKLIKPDEGRYAEIPREMVATGDWLTPRLNGLKYFEKPPLQYWATAVAYEAFGASEWTSRLWTALTGFAGVLVVGWTAARLYDRRTGAFAAAALASTLAWMLLAHFDSLDTGLAFFTTATLCAVLVSRRARSGGTGEPPCAPGTVADRASRRWMLVAWASLALAVLSKGPVAVVLCAGALVAYVAVSRDGTLVRGLAVARGLALFALVAGPWFVAVSRANRDFAHFFFVHEHVERFLTTEHRREGPLWYFVPVIVVGALPWLSLVPKAIVDGWRAPPRGAFAPERLIVVFAAGVFVFFSLSGSKLPSYVLPLFPPLAILVGRTLATVAPRTTARHLAFAALVAAAAGVAFVVAPFDVGEPADAVARFRAAGAASCALWCVGTVVAAALAARARVAAAVVVASSAALVSFSALMASHEIIGRGMSTYDLAAAMRPSIAPDTTIYSVGTFEASLDFYLERTVTLVSFRDELDFGLTAEPERGLRTYQQFAERWDAERAPLAVMADDVFATLTTMRVPMRVIARDGRRLVVAKP